MHQALIEGAEGISHRYSHHDKPDLLINYVPAGSRQRQFKYNFHYDVAIRHKFQEQGRPIKKHRQIFDMLYLR